MPLFLKIILCIIVMQSLGGLGAFLTVGSVDFWYQTLNHPPRTPPNWVFGPVWGTLYAMIGVSFALVWQKLGSNFWKSAAFRIFIIQLLLNLAWTPIFFGAHQMIAALVVIVAMWIAIALTIRTFKQHSHPAAYFLIPYLTWVSYATYLNAGYAWFN